MAPKTRRKSAFQEIGLSGKENTISPTPPKRERPQSVRFRSKDEVHLLDRYEDDEVTETETRGRQARRNSEYSRSINLIQSPLPAWSHSMMYRLGAAIFVLAAMIPLLHATAIFGHSPALPIPGVSGGVIPEEARVRTEIHLEKREDSPERVCFRWAQQCRLSRGHVMRWTC